MVAVFSGQARGDRFKGEPDVGGWRASVCRCSRAPRRPVSASPRAIPGVDRQPGAGVAARCDTRAETGVVRSRKQQSADRRLLEEKSWGEGGPPPAVRVVVRIEGDKERCCV